MSKFFILPLVLILGLGAVSCSSKNKEVQAEAVDAQKSFKFTPQELEQKMINSGKEPLERLDKSTYRIIDKYHGNNEIQISVNSENKVTKIDVMSPAISKIECENNTLSCGKASFRVFNTALSILNPLNGYRFKQNSPVKEALDKYYKGDSKQGENYNEFHFERGFMKLKDDEDNIILMYQITPS